MDRAGEADVSSQNIQYEHSDRLRGLASGGIGVMHRLAQHTGLVEAIDWHVQVGKCRHKKNKNRLL